ncbi:hypothetical protein UUU_10030 [Klebsiella pneumoniae subsp. pneumoniae DSM 30104 = JCM 1662 = NBRC 14940]|nr:hypothetical protein UUU_10030 [Klebsiella pneumoniae subsp. pneumoniae DSM 30104 = JCM 1662 = NBRC 14940]
MNQVKIQIVELEPFKGAEKCFARIFVTCILNPHFGCYK